VLNTIELHSIELNTIELHSIVLNTIELHSIELHTYIYIYCSCVDII